VSSGHPPPGGAEKRRARPAGGVKARVDRRR
jgi:hypothetical protein